MVVTTVSSLGTQLKREGVAIANIKGISGPALSRDLADVTNLGSPNGFEEVMPTILRTGEVTFTISVEQGNTQHNILRTDVVTATARNFAIVFPTPVSGTAQTHSFTGYVTNYGNEFELESEITAEVTIKPTSTITVT